MGVFYFLHVLEYTMLGLMAMDNTKDIEANRIVRYLDNEMTKEELAGFELWLKADKNRKLFKEYVIANHYIELGRATFDDKVPFSTFLKAIDKTGAKGGGKKLVYQFLKYAAILVGVVLGTTYFLTTANKESKAVSAEVTLELNDGSVKQIVDNGSDVKIKNGAGQVIGIQKKDKLLYSATKEPNEEVAVEMNTLRVPYGKKFRLVLSDGTEVYVNSGSVLKFPSQFMAGDLRKVELEGEAFFKVAKNKEVAFVVKTKGLSTEVFGTAFNVSSYKDDSFTEVLLVEGSVGVFHDKERFNEAIDSYLTPGQKARHMQFDEKIEISDVEVDQYIAWVDGVLMFRNETFTRIIKRLERHYNVKVIVNYEGIKQEKFTGEFDVESVENVLNTFKGNTPFNFEMKENKIIINP